MVYNQSTMRLCVGEIREMQNVTNIAAKEGDFLLRQSFREEQEQETQFELLNVCTGVHCHVGNVQCLCVKNKLLCV